LADVQPGDHVLEIGPGPGALTEQLLAAGASVLAVEKDTLLANGLSRLGEENLKIFNDDILKFPIEKSLQGKKKTKVIANLPYNITTPILEILLPLHHCLDSITVMVQDEVARRMTAKPGNRIYGSLSVFLQFYGEPRYGFKVAPGSFFPAPTIDSAVVHIDLKEPPNIDKDHFFGLTRTAFGQRRKMLRKSLKDLIEEETFLAANISPTARPEELSLQEWLTLAQESLARKSD
jgi:16S rRNA (adenine1518-N6/adenine1519-N6)-dimethyltransferase